LRRLWVEAVLVERLLYCAACGGRLYRGHALVLKVIEGSEVKPGDMVFIVSTQAPPAYDAGVILEAKGSLYGEEGGAQADSQRSYLSRLPAVHWEGQRALCAPQLELQACESWRSCEHTLDG